MPFVLVVTRELVRPEDTVPLLRLAGGTKPGVVDRNHAEGDLATYQPAARAGARRPGGRPKAYLLTGVQRGEEFCNVRPEDALPVILGRGRTPLTIDEGIAVVTHAPHLLEKNKCFMLSGSRRHDRRVPAMWISERGAQARLVLGRQPAHLAGGRLGRRTDRGLAVLSTQVGHEVRWRHAAE